MTDECKGDCTSATHLPALGFDGVIRCIYCGLIQSPYYKKNTKSDTDAS